jgi:hypothetical protein
MNRQIAVLLVLVILAVGCSSRTPDAAVTETTEPSSPSESASVASPLEGEWDTGPYPADRAPAAIVAAGYSDEASADEAVGGERRFECNFLFYEEGGVPFVAVRCWDPDERGTEPPLESDPWPLPAASKRPAQVGVRHLRRRYQLQPVLLRAPRGDADPALHPHRRS